MKGLIRNNYYTIKSGIDICMCVFLVAILVIVLGNVLFFDYKIDINLIVFVFTTSSISLSYTLLQNNSTSKWEKFELTTPISKTDVIKARYIVFVGIMIASLLLGLILYSLEYLIFSSNFNNINLERFGYIIFASFSLFIIPPAIYHPLILTFGIDNGQTIYTTSIIATLAYILIPSLIFNKFLVNNFTDPELAYRLIMSGLSIIIFSFSYIISKNIYLNKDL
ncbi:MAG: ABC-2 transporter permease [bacterium]